jgi:peptidoglycan hydrolase-like protein with peptidoglycan-binding domain
MALTSLRFSRDPRLQQASENNPPLKQGATGEAVATVQRALVDLGFDMPITTSHNTKLPDGIFGAETARIVREFQKLNSLEVDGVVGRHTLQKLEELTAAQSAAQRAEFVATAQTPPAFSSSYHRTLRP